MHTLRVVREYRDADTVELVAADGTVAHTLTARHADGLINWCADWPALVDYALSPPNDEIRRVFHPGHGDPCAQFEEYYLV